MIAISSVLFVQKKMHQDHISSILVKNFRCYFSPMKACACHGQEVYRLSVKGAERHKVRAFAITL
jgi:hypothetical protein